MQMDDLKLSDITLVKNAIHNPADAKHFLRIKPVNRLVKIAYNGTIIAETTTALRLLEVGHDLYDPALYIPVDALQAKLVVNLKISHCPLKGDAQYFDLVDEKGVIIKENIAWSYASPFEFITDIKGFISFYTDQVTIEEIPL